MSGRVSLATLAAALLFAAPASATLPAGNLVVNPGAEAAPGATDSGTQVALPGWTVTGKLTAVAYGTPAFLTTEDGARWAAAPTSSPADLTGTAISRVAADQRRGAAPEIDKGVTGTLSALIGGFASQDDSATVSAQPLDAAGAPIAPPTAARGDGRRIAGHRSPAAHGTGVDPARHPVDRRHDHRHAHRGQYNDGYVDNVSFSFGGPPVAGKSVGAQPVSGTVLVKLPGSAKFVPLDPSVIPNGTEVDARKGVVEITRADGGVARSSTTASSSSASPAASRRSR